MALTATGCAIRTPATVGHIGSVEIPAGIYLLAQYEAYSTAAGTPTSPPAKRPTTSPPC